MRFFDLLSHAVHFGNRHCANGYANAHLQRNGKNQIVVEFVADSTWIRRRNRNEESGFVRQRVQFAGCGFFHEDGAALTDRLVQLFPLLLALREETFFYYESRFCVLKS